MNNKSLKTTCIDKLLGEMKFVDVVILGRWRKHKQDDDNFRNDYIVVDTEFLNLAFRNFGTGVKYLSLGGTSGIQHLPDSISHLGSTACNNLESLPKKIGSLKYLVVSQCYFLDHIPCQITLLSNLIVLKGFIIDDIDPNAHLIQRTRSSKSHNNNIKWYKKISSATPSPSCPFNELHRLKQLQKLALRTRRINFPTIQDLNTLCQLEDIRNLGITWVVNTASTTQLDDINYSEGISFPNKVEKLQIQSAPHLTATQLLQLVRKQKDSKLKKLYIRGGYLQELIPEKHHFPNVEVVSLRYLHKFNMEWDQFKNSFPRLLWLQLFDCPNLTSFPCDNTGIWKPNNDP